MKKIILSSVFALSLFVVSCSASNPTGTTNTNTGVTLTGNATLDGCQKLLSCMITKDPTNAKDYQQASENLKKLTGDEQLAASAVCQVYDIAAKLYGCN